MTSYTCEKCGGNSYENFTPTQVKCIYCGNITIMNTGYKTTSGFRLSNDSTLLDFEKKINYKKADLGKRFINYITDLIIAFFLSFVIATITAGIVNFTSSSEDMIGTTAILFFPFYYIFMEYKFGKTIGKFITKTKVISKDGHSLSLGQCVGRLLCRMIPFDRFSCLFTDGVFWHDSIPGTLVVED